MKNKLVNLYGDNKTPENKENKYSSLLEDFISPFIKHFDDFEFQEDIFEFAIHAWNLGNMKSIMDEDEFEEIINLAKVDDPVNYSLLRKMTTLKAIKFKEYTNFIIDFDVKVSNDTIVFKVKTEEENSYMAGMLVGSSNNSSSNNDFEEKYINRSAISIKPLQPFIDWHNAIYPDSSIDETDLNDINIYLINNASYEDVEAYLKKKFDKYFMMELEGWHTDKRDWPQRRNYKMFKKWFQVNICTAVFDLEKTPISKSE